MTELRAPSLASIHEARERIASFAIRSPLLRLALDEAPGEIWLKCENLQPTGSYKNRPQGAILTALAPGEATHGVYTASSGNAGLGMAWAARRLGIDARVYVPENADPAKLTRLEALGAGVQKISYAAWWSAILGAGNDDPGTYIDAVRDPRALAGNGSIGLEILEDLPDVDTIVAPFGGGGLISGVAAAVRALKPDTRIVAAEVDTARPLAAAFANRRPTVVPVEPSFVQSIGAARVLDPMWPLLRELVDEATHASLAETCDAIRILAVHAKLIAEGSAGVALASVLAGRVPGRQIVCLVSGGNIGPSALATILSGGVP